MSAYDELAARWQHVMMPNYGTPPVALVQGKGCRVWDADGRDYLDLLAGIAVSSLGHAHPAVVDAVSHQVATLAHTSNLYLHEPGVRLAERLTGLLDTPDGTEARVFFCSTGTEANEAALKLVLRHGAATGRRRIVAADHGFHGRTLGALSLTGKASIREPFGPYGTDVVFVPYGDAEALAAVVDEHTAAVLLETTQGEAGVVPPPDGYLVAARGGSATPQALCCGSTRSRARSGAPATGTPTRRTASCRTSSPSPRVSAAGCPSAPASASGPRPPPSSGATTAPRSAATWSRSVRPSPCSTRSRPTTCSVMCARWARASLPASPPSGTRCSPGYGAVGCGWRSS